MSNESKNPTGTFMRLIWKQNTTELVYVKHKRQADLRLLFALKKQIDKRVADYFIAYPEQAPGQADSPPSRMGVFVRKVAAWRRAEIDYKKVNTEQRFKAMFAARRAVDADLDSYFAQVPSEAPIEVTQQHLPLLK